MKSFELTTSHAISILVLLLTFILFFQPYMFGFMIHNILGRFTLLLILILVSSYKIIFGLIGVGLLIYLYEHYHKYEGFESNDLTSSKKLDEPVSDDIETEKTPEKMPEKTKNATTTTTSMSQTKKTELENSMIPKDSSQLLSSKTQSSDKVSPSESSTTKPSSNKEGFASMFKLEPSTF